MSIAAHLWTVRPLLTRREAPPEATPWQLAIRDSAVGEVRLTGYLGGEIERGLLVLVHGLGGCAESRYVLRASRIAAAMGLATLRLNLRGADRQGNDIYHAGLVSDLEALLESPCLARASRIYVLGFSLGGHIALRFATEAVDRRLKAVAAICSPLDLEASARAFDRPSRFLYRRYVLSGLFDIYDAVARRREVPIPSDVVRRITKIREFDRLVVAPRFGFEGPEDYYRKMSVGRRLDQLRVESLLVAVENDPMVDAGAIRPALLRKPDALDVRWSSKGGHMSFPADLDLGFEAPLGLEPQILHWLLRHG